MDMFLANRKNVDMFLELKVRTGGIVDMFLTAILRTGTKNDYLFRFLVPCRDGMFTYTCVNRITKGREQIVNKTFVKILDELGYDVELTYKKKESKDS